MSQKIGILGAGQLGKMLALAGYNLGFKFSFFDPNPESPSFEIGTKFKSEYTTEKILEFAKGLDFLTFEFENIPLDIIKALEVEYPKDSVLKINPGSKALEITQNRIKEKNLFNSLSIPTVNWKKISNKDDLLVALQDFGDSSILKTTSLGYDGKGQIFINKSDPDYENIIINCFSILELSECILEEYIPFDREVSLISARSTFDSSKIIHYPLIENYHHKGILRTSYAPLIKNNSEVYKEAITISESIIEALDYFGIITVEFFEKNGKLYANEIAPRVHNSGHLTIEGATTSQFENHIRAICGLPLGDTSIQTSVGMLNIINNMPQIEKLLLNPKIKLHSYGKLPKENRKIGHLTMVDNDLILVVNTFKNLESEFKLSNPNSINFFNQNVYLNMFNSKEILVLFFILVSGLAIGKIVIKGFSLGAAGVLIVGLICGDFGFKVPAGILDFGLLLFFYSVGLQSGPQFFLIFKKSSLKFLFISFVPIFTAFLFTIFYITFSNKPGVYTRYFCRFIN